MDEPPQRPLTLAQAARQEMARSHPAWVTVNPSQFETATELFSENLPVNSPQFATMEIEHQEKRSHRNSGGFFISLTRQFSGLRDSFTGKWVPHISPEMWVVRWRDRRPRTLSPLE